MKLQGVIAAIVTPLDGKREPDAKAFYDLASWLLANGCDGLNVLGTTGEATSFSVEQRMKLMKAAAASGLPMARMMVGTGAAAVQDAVTLARQAADCGFAGALVVPQFYYKNVPEDGVMRYIEAIVEATRTTQIPLYLYHYPAMSGVPYTAALVKRLIDRFGERIAGLKDSSGDLDYARTVAKISSRFAVFPGSEASLGEARSGVFAGCISATANVTSAFCARAFHQGDDTALAAAVRIRKLLESKPFVPGVKALLSRIRNLPALAEVLPPFMPLTEAETASLFQAYGKIVSEP
ncbi:MAG: dihydrodipicolinate synthase family protein [Rhizobiales bacterium]|nr:dihydrodipicolinate synthase family protein [Hyphomicrobiales bacterium]